MSKKKITANDWLLICLGIVLLLAGVFIGKHLYKCKPAPVDTHAYDIIINQREKLIDSVERANMQLGLSIQTRDSLIAELQQSRDNITNHFVRRCRPLFYRIVYLLLITMLSMQCASILHLF